MYYVTDEWAKQLALEFYPDKDIDFANLRIYRTDQPDRQYRFHVLPEEIKYMSRPSAYILFEYDIVTMKGFADTLNMEATWLGYAPRVNILVLGQTRKYRNWRLGLGGEDEMEESYDWG